MEGIVEAIDVGRQAGIPVQISHIKGYVGGTAADFETLCRTIEETFKTLSPHRVRIDTWKDYRHEHLDDIARDEKKKGILSLQSAILSMTSRPAEKFGIKERGKIVPGYYADLCVIDPATLRAPATYEQPARYSEGVTHVLVNGVFEVENGIMTGVRSSRALRRS
ncbi:MAG: amidohydrolase family protein [Syntrophales bacterium]